MYRGTNVLVTSREAARRLGVKPATLYAYVSRGLLRSAAGADNRERRYYADDVERLRRLRHSGRRSGTPPKPFDPLSPVLDSSICLIEGGRLYYRGVDAAKLAEHADLEETARLLWASGAHDPFAAPEPALRLPKRASDLPAALSPIERARAVLVEIAVEDIGALDTSPDQVARTGARLLRALAAGLSAAKPGTAPLHAQLATAWGIDRGGADLIRRCLVLTADHELNASTYVARCVASTGASPYAVVLAAIGALSGPRHGGETSHVEILIRHLASSRDTRREVAGRLQRGERVPGFGHPLYPDGDPRAASILGALAAGKLARRSGPVLGIGNEIAGLIGRKPNIDFALGAVSFVLGLPPGAGLGMFLLGRTAGWIAHAIEQYAAGTLIRPRARYTGTLPVA
jgi:citrate synthase